MTRRFNAGDVKAYDELWSNRIVGHGPAGNFGLEDVKRYHAAWRKGFSDLRVKLYLICVAGDFMSSRIGFSGTHDGVYLEKPRRENTLKHGEWTSLG